MTGHMLGAAGSAEAIVCVKAMRDGIIPPTINLEVPDEELDLDYVPGVAKAGTDLYHVQFTWIWRSQWLPAAKEVYKVILLNKEQIKEIIPHRDPFLLIDEIVEMEEGKRALWQ